MQVDPMAESFGDIEYFSPDLEEVRKVDEKFAKLCREGKIVARSDSKEALQKLQADLRKIGYRHQK